MGVSAFVSAFAFLAFLAFYGVVVVEEEGVVLAEFGNHVPVLFLEVVGVGAQGFYLFLYLGLCLELLLHLFADLMS